MRGHMTGLVPPTTTRVFVLIFRMAASFCVSGDGGDGVVHEPDTCDIEPSAARSNFVSVDSYPITDPEMQSVHHFAKMSPASVEHTRSPSSHDE